MFAATLPGDGHDYLVADFDDLDGVREQVAEGLRKGEYQILVNNPGGPLPGKLYEAEIEAFDQAIKRHLYVSQTLVADDTYQACKKPIMGG